MYSVDLPYPEVKVKEKNSKYINLILNLLITQIYK